MGLVILVVLAVVGLVILGVLVWLISVYNRLISLNNAIENTFNQIRVAMKKRFDMIGQLVDTTKSYLKYEKEVFTGVAKLRTMPLESAEDIKNADGVASSLLGRIFAVMENYPKLQGIEAVKELQESIKSVEDEIARQRYLYNDQVQTFNTLIQLFPNNLIAGMFGFTKKPYLHFGEEIESRPDTKVW